MKSFSKIQLLQILSQGENLAHYLQQTHFENSPMFHGYTDFFEAVDNTQDLAQLKLFCIEQLDRIQISLSLAKIVIEVTPTLQSFVQKHEQMYNLTVSQSQKIQQIQSQYLQLIHESEIQKSQQNKTLESIEKQLREALDEKDKLGCQLKYLQKNYQESVCKFAEIQQKMRKSHQMQKQTLQTEINNLKNIILDLESQIKYLEINHDPYVRLAKSQIYLNPEESQNYLSQFQQQNSCLNQSNQNKFDTHRSLAQDLNEICDESQDEQNKIQGQFHQCCNGEKISTKESFYTEYYSIEKQFPKPKGLKKANTKRIGQPLLKASLNFKKKNQISTGNLIQKSMLTIPQQTKQKDSAFNKIHIFLHQNIIEKKLKKFRKI